MQLQIQQPAAMGWSMDQLLRGHSSTVVQLASRQGLKLQGSFLRSRMVLPAGAGSGATAATGDSKGAQEVALFLGAPRLDSFSELRVGCSARYSREMRAPFYVQNMPASILFPIFSIK